ncbi:ATP-binding protein [Streptomyces sp. SID8352]|uniref:ATP-binding protein n=1 Tax=Streptomyces sp. SID8352 TaxID=2690338 RepID=UPI0013691095|nr:ATP-binding protein [Streptomyces sp. SID8352]MYU20695.1 ATP-binding protein [Streptomyces sp. SID8352]
MSAPAPPSPPRTRHSGRSAPTPLLVVLPAAAAAAGAAWAAAPGAAKGWTATLAVTSWLCVAVVVGIGSRLIRRAHRTAAERTAENAALKAQLAHENAGCLHLANVVLPGVTRRLREGAGADEAVAGAPAVPGPHLRQVLQSYASLAEDAVRRTGDAEARHRTAQHELSLITTELDHLTGRTLPGAVARLRDGTSAQHVLAELDWPQSGRLRALSDLFVRELAHSERRTAAAQAASAKSLSRVQAKAVSMLADLREMQDRHGEDVLGDLLRLDHSTSQLGLITDRLAVLMGGRASRAWNKPIVMENILRGAVGRIAAYRRVRMHCSTRAAISGYAAEGVMHLLAELMDNAANFSPPIDEVHVYVEERTAGIVVTVEDSGLRMADAAMHHAEEAVSGRSTDLAQLQGTRLGLAVVGRLAAKYRIGVSYRPSSRGGTGVVVLLPPQLLAQQRVPVPVGAGRTPAAGTPVGARNRGTGPVPAPGTTPVPAPAAGHLPVIPRPAAPPDSAPHPLESTPPARPVPTGLPEQQDRHHRPATPGGLPVRAPGRTMAEAERERGQQTHAAHDPTARSPYPEPHDRVPALPRDAGSRFGAYHRGRLSGAAGSPPGGTPPATEPPAPA